MASIYMHFSNFWTTQRAFQHMSAFNHSLIHLQLIAGGYSTKSSSSYTHIHRNGTAIRSNLDVQYLARGHFDRETRGAGDRTTDLLISGRPALPFELQLPNQRNKFSTQSCGAEKALNWTFICQAHFFKLFFLKWLQCYNNQVLWCHWLGFGLSVLLCLRVFILRVDSRVPAPSEQSSGSQQTCSITVSSVLYEPWDWMENTLLLTWQYFNTMPKYFGSLGVISSYNLNLSVSHWRYYGWYHWRLV